MDRWEQDKKARDDLIVFISYLLDCWIPLSSSLCLLGDLSHKAISKPLEKILKNSTRALFSKTRSQRTKSAPFYGKTLKNCCCWHRYMEVIPQLNKLMTSSLMLSLPDLLTCDLCNYLHYQNQITTIIHRLCCSLSCIYFSHFIHLSLWQ